METFLSLVGKKLNSERIYLPNNINHTLRFRKNERSFASLWFRTVGCRYSRAGGCTMCDYFISKDVSEEDMYSFFLDAMKELPEPPSLMVIMTSGSFFDPDEVPPDVRTKIYKYLSAKLPNTIFVFETHAFTINEEIINECLQYFPPEQIQVEIGVETSDEWIRKYCINKWITNRELEKTINMLNNKNIATIANFVIGIPFLTLKENIISATESIKWAIKNGAMKASLFPVNLKPFTLVHWMHQQGMYQQPPLWALIDVLSSVRSVFLPRIDINWYQKKAPLENPLYSASIQGPDSCDLCYNQVIAYLNKYFLGDINRKEILDELNNVECECRTNYKNSLQNEIDTDLKTRVKNRYKEIGNLLFGRDFWAEENKAYLDL